MKKILHLVFFITSSSFFAGNTSTKLLQSPTFPHAISTQPLSINPNALDEENRTLADLLELPDYYNNGLPPEIQKHLNSFIEDPYFLPELNIRLNLNTPQINWHYEPTITKTKDKTKIWQVKLNNQTRSIEIYKSIIKKKKDIIKLKQDILSRTLFIGKDLQRCKISFSPHSETFWVAKQEGSTIKQFKNSYPAHLFPTDYDNEIGNFINLEANKYITNFELHPFYCNLLLIEYKVSENDQQRFYEICNFLPPTEFGKKENFPLEQFISLKHIPPQLTLTFKQAVADSTHTAQINFVIDTPNKFDKFINIGLLMRVAQHWLTLKNPDLQLGKKIVDFVKQNKIYSPYFIIFNAQQHYDNPCTQCKQYSCYHRNLFKDIYKKITSRNIITR